MQTDPLVTHRLDHVSTAIDQWKLWTRCVIGRLVGTHRNKHAFVDEFIHRNRIRIRQIVSADVVSDPDFWSQQLNRYDFCRINGLLSPANPALRRVADRSRPARRSVTPRRSRGPPCACVKIKPRSRVETPKWRDCQV